MINSLNHVAIILSAEDHLAFYRKLGFRETSRQVRPEKKDTLIMMDNGNTVLEVFIRNDPPKRHCDPEAAGLRHMAFNVDNVEEILEVLKDYPHQDIRTTAEGRRLVFINDDEGQPVEFMEESIRG